MKLVVVESPAKVKTIGKYLGRGYRVSASMGHLVDLPKNELGVDTEKDFEPKYIVTNRKALKKLKNDFKGTDTLIIASDLDREGEAIGWHVAQKLGVIGKTGRLKDKNIKVKRIVFASITKDAIQEAIASPRSLDFDLIDAQQARRILDRLVGYKLSPLLWKKIRYGLSAGRVQSVAVRLIVDREEERKKFKQKEYWSVLADLLTKASRKKAKQLILESKKDTAQRENGDNGKIKYKGIKFELVRIDNKKAKVKDEKEVKRILRNLDNKKWIIIEIKKKESKRYPKPPFITSTLQRTAVNLFGYDAKRTMRVAQKLYERGFITYMRTDSFNLNKGELEKIRSYINKSYGKRYLPPRAIYYKSRGKGAQEAHEAIRPTNVLKDGNKLKLNGDQKKLYNLIRKRTLACQMSPAKVENTKLFVKAGKYTFQATGQRMLFDGYMKAYRDTLSENILPKLEKKQELYPEKLIGKQHFTSPPPRYSEASLIKMLEQFGIGRPSTYAPIISTILARKYVRKDGRYFIPTDTGIIVTKLLKKYFSDIVDTGFTAAMEKDLDSIAQGNVDKKKVIKNFYKPFIKDVEKGEKNIKREEFTVLGKSKWKCPVCGKRMVEKIGRFGKFLSCSDFPKCKGMRSIEGKTEEDRDKEVQKLTKSSEFKKKYRAAPKAEDGKKMILKIGRYGKFWAHPNYPKVKEAKPLLLKEKCPKCGENLVERKGRWGKMFIGCSGYPKCKYIKGRKGKRRSRKKK